MLQRGRRGIAALTAPTAAGATTLIERPEAPLDLTPEQSDVWRSIVDAMPADWFPRETWSLLSQYCRHTVAARRVAHLIDVETARDEVDIGALDKLMAMQARETASLKAMAAAMRLAQQSSRTDGAAATAKRGARTVKRPWESD